MCEEIVNKIRCFYALKSFLTKHMDLKRFSFLQREQTFPKAIFTAGKILLKDGSMAEDNGAQEAGHLPRASKGHRETESPKSARREEFLLDNAQ